MRAIVNEYRMELTLAGLRLMILRYCIKTCDPSKKDFNSTYRLFALSTADYGTIHVLTPKVLFHLVLDDVFVIAKGAFLQVVEMGSLDFSMLLYTVVQIKKCRRKESFQLGLRNVKHASRLIHANDIMIVLAQEGRCVGRYATLAE
jgi:hypothetical protein